MSPDSQPESIPNTAPSASPVPPPSKPPWPFWAVAIVSGLLGPLAGFLIAWKNFQRLGQTNFSRKFYLKIGGFLIALLILFTLLSFWGVFPEYYLILHLFYPYWVWFFEALLGNFTSVIISLFLYIAFTILFNLPQLKQNLKDKQECSFSIIPYGILGLAISILLINLFYRTVNALPKKTEFQSISVIPTIIPTATFSPLPTKVNEKFEITPTPPPYYIKILDNKLSSEPYTQPIEGKVSDCQPEFFDPQTTKFHKVKQEGIPSETYVLDNDDKYTHFMINGWSQEGEDKITLPSPYEVTMYRFGCASTHSYVLDIKKDSQRLFLFNHIEEYRFYPDKKLLFLASRIKNNSGEWERKVRIINLETKEKIELPNVECTADSGVWDQGKLITYGGTDHGCPGTIKICIWNRNGQLQTHLQGFLDQFAGAGCFLTSSFGLLPTDNNIFYATVIGNVTDSGGEDYSDKCMLALQSLNQQNINKAFTLVEKEYGHCEGGDMEFDLKNLKLSSNKVRFRQLEDYVKKIWSPWKEAISEEKNTTTKVILNNYEFTLSNGWFFGKVLQGYLVPDPIEMTKCVEENKLLEEQYESLRKDQLKKCAEVNIILKGKGYSKISTKRFPSSNAGGGYVTTTQEFKKISGYETELIWLGDIDYLDKKTGRSTKKSTSNGVPDLDYAEVDFNNGMYLFFYTDSYDGNKEYQDLLDLIKSIKIQKAQL